MKMVVDITKASKATHYFYTLSLFFLHFTIDKKHFETEKFLVELINRLFYNYFRPV